MTDAMPATAELAGVKWHFQPCPECGTTGTRHRERGNVLLDCRTCRGRGYLRTIIHNDHPTRNGKKQTA